MEEGFDIPTYHPLSIYGYNKQPLLKGHHHRSAYVTQNLLMVSQSY